MAEAHGPRGGMPSSSWQDPPPQQLDEACRLFPLPSLSGSDGSANWSMGDVRGPTGAPAQKG